MFPAAPTRNKSEVFWRIIMRLFSTAALSLALAASAGLLMPAGALAQKKDEKAAAAPAAGPQLKPTAAYVKAITPVQAALKASKVAEAKPLLDAAAATINGTDDD